MSPTTHKTIDKLTKPLVEEDKPIVAPKEEIKDHYEDGAKVESGEKVESQIDNVRYKIEN